MNAMKNEKGRQTKLLAAIAILAMVVCAFAVVMPSDDVNATPTTPDKAPLGTADGFTYANGVYTVSADQKVDLAKEEYNLGTVDAPLDIRFEISNGATLTFTNSSTETKTLNITYTTDGSDAIAKSIFYGGNTDSYGTVAVDGNVNLNVNLGMDGSDTLNNCHALYNVNVNLDNGAVMTVSQAANVGGQTYWVGSTTNLATTTISGGSQLVMSNANGMSGVNANVTENSGIVVENTKEGKVWMNFNDLSVDKTSSVKVKDGTATGIYITKTLTNEGVVDAGNANIGTAKGATIDNKSTGTIRAASIEGEGSINNDNGKIDAKVSPTVAYPDRDFTNVITLGDGVVIDDSTFINASSTQEIRITGDVTIVKGGYFTVEGKLTVAENANLTIEEGGYVNIGATGIVDIQGDLYNEAGTTAQPTFSYAGCGMTVAGTVTLEGANSFKSTGTGISISGIFEVGADATADFNGAQIAEGGELVIDGIVNGSVTNAGTITVDSQGIPDATTTSKINAITLEVTLRATGTLDIVNIYGKITVNDDGLTYGKDAKAVANNSEVVIENVAGVTVTESVDDKGVNTMFVAGSVVVADNYNSTDVTGSKITVSAGEKSNVEIAEATTLGEGVDLSISGKLTVSGDVTANAETEMIEVADGGVLTVTGKITTISKGVTETGTVNAAKYIGAASAVIYTTLQTALNDGATSIDLLGANTVDADTTIPVGTVVDMADKAVLTIKEDATLTVASDDRKSGKISPGSVEEGKKPIVVEGTLVLQNASKSGIKDADVMSDTFKAAEPAKTYTNIYKALADAVDGETVEITSTAAEGVVIDKDVEVKTGVTLSVPNGKMVTVDYGATVTVNGTVVIAGDYVITPALEEDNKDTSVAGATVVNGKFQYQDSADKAEYQKYIVGAYFDYDGKNTIMPLASVPAIADDLESDVELYGDMDLGAIDFTAYTGSDLTVTTYNKLTVDTYTVGGTTFVAGDGSCVNGTIVLANGSVVLSNVNGITAADSTDAEGTVTSAVQGTVKPYDDNDAKTTDKGTVSFTGSVSSSSTYNENVAVSVPTGATLIVTGGSFKDLTVQGTLEGKANFSVEKAVISGTVNMAEKMTLSATTLYAGVTVETVDDVDYITSTTDAAINGGISATTAYFGPSVTVPESFTDSANSYASTAYYVEGDLYVSAYTKSTVSISKIGVDLDNADFKGWMDKDGKAAAGNIGSLKEVYASLDYNICEVTVSTLPGATIYIDGQPYDGGKISVGEHNISVYVKPGYTGEPQITVNGQAVENGGTFTASADAPTQISVSGITTGNYAGGDDGGLGLTEILLIILVVLIVIMAIMVALRLMRS